MPPNSAGYLHGNLEHHLDHLAPFCSLMNWPLIVTESEMFELAKLYYPELEVRLHHPLQAPFEVTDQFNFIVTTLPRALFDDIFCIAELTLGKRLKTGWLPHGHSDKENLEPLAKEETLFVYGPNFICGTSSQTLVPIGNFRAVYFQKHRHFYSTLLDSLNIKQSFILYAPTWNDARNSSSLENAADILIQNLSDFPFLIKPHPNETQTPRSIQRKLSSTCWLDNFPPIYPLLERTSHLIGDFSSIGYDFLHFNRPMFFLKGQNKAAPLHKMGKTVNATDLPAELHLPQHNLHAAREALYHATFGKQVPWETIAKQILDSINYDS